MLVGTMAINLSSATVSQSWNSNQEATHFYILFSTFFKTGWKQLQFCRYIQKILQLKKIKYIKVL